jgi:hypothetical protein
MYGITLSSWACVVVSDSDHAALWPLDTDGCFLSRIFVQTQEEDNSH